jgi:hypothetical protein
VTQLVRTLLFAAFWLLGAGTVASAEPAQQAATATPVPPPSSSGTQVPCVNTRSGVQIILGNPQPGDTLLSGSQVILQGVAYDPAATSVTGVSSVTAFLGDRTSGGISLGAAILGLPNPQAPAGSQFANAGFQLRTISLPSGSGGRSIFIYAQSSVNSAEGVLEVPIFLNAAPTPVRGQVPTAVLPTPAPCTPVPTVAPTNTATPVPAVVAATSTPLPVATPIPPVAPVAPAAPAPVAPVAPIAPAAPAPAAPAPAAAAPAPAAAPATAQTTAPRGGGIPSEVGLAILSLGALVVGGGWALRRRDRRALTAEGDSAARG